MSLGGEGARPVGSEGMLVRLGGPRWGGLHGTLPCLRLISHRTFFEQFMEILKRVSMLLALRGTRGVIRGDNGHRSDPSRFLRTWGLDFRLVRNLRTTSFRRLLRT